MLFRKCLFCPFKTDFKGQFTVSSLLMKLVVILFGIYILFLAKYIKKHFSSTSSSVKRFPLVVERKFVVQNV